MKTFQKNTVNFAFYATGLSACPYHPERTERKIVTDLAQGDPTRYHDLLSQAGFRRSHRIAYAPACPECNACTPVRVRASEFQPNKTFRRIIRNNADLQTTPCLPQATGEQHRLFMAYQNQRHSGGDMASMSFTDYKAMIEETPIESFIYEYRNPEDRLVAAVLIDVMMDGLSAVYSFFEADDPKRSLGTYIVLSLIDVCKQFDLPYLYLGYWISDCAKMSYKTRYQPLEAFGPNGWQDLK